MLKAGAFTVATLLLGTACGVGDDGGPTVDNKGMNGLQCTTTYTTKGSVKNVPAIPDNDGDGQPDILGCWPSGTWTFTATESGGDGVVPACSPAGKIEPQYEVAITYGCYPAGKSCAPTAPPENAGEYGFDVQMVTQVPLRNHLKYSSGGGGLCEGIFEFYSDDGKSLWNFHPVLAADSSLAGQGEFQRFDANQYAP